MSAAHQSEPLANRRIARGLPTPQEVLDLIAQAAVANELALVETTLAATGEPVMVLIRHYPDEQNGGKGFGMVPLALLFNSSPFDVLNPPADAIVVDPHANNAKRD